MKNYCYLLQRNLQKHLKFLALNSSVRYRCVEEKMSIKSILLSILALVLAAGIIVGVIFLFQVQFIFGLLEIALIFIPISIQKKAIDASSGKFDKVFAKFIVPALLFIAIVFIVLYFTLWR